MVLFPYAYFKANYLISNDSKTSVFINFESLDYYQPVFHWKMLRELKI